jgi:hypothetical protein
MLLVYVLHARTTTQASLDGSTSGAMSKRRYSQQTSSNGFSNGQSGATGDSSTEKNAPESQLISLSKDGQGVVDEGEVRT